MVVIVVGLNHRTVPLDVLERMTVSSAQLPKALDDLLSRSQVAEAVVLSTCHRTEVYLAAERFHPAVSDVRNFLSALAFLPPEEFAGHLYEYHDEVAVTHLFEVVSGIDSVVLGESEIVGQVRSAWEVARAQKAAGPTLSGLFRHALEAGKRARSETSIARHITSVSQAAVAMAAERLGTLEGRSVLVLGAGDMGETMAVALAGAGVADVLVANRTRAKALALARRVGGRGITLDELPAALAGVDVLLTSTGAPDFVLDRDTLEAIVAGRAGRPLLIVDIAVPRDVDPGVASLPGVTLLDMDDLKSFVAVGIDKRRNEIAKVRAILAEEVARYEARSVAREVTPTVVELRERAEAVRAAELARFRARLDALTDDQRAVVEELTKGIVAKLLHEPTARLKGAAGEPSGRRLNEALRTLFDL